MSKERVIVFIDGTALDRMITLLKIDLDYVKLKTFLTGDRALVEIYYYHYQGKLSYDTRKALEEAGYTIQDGLLNPEETYAFMASQIREHRSRADCVTLVGGKDNFIAPMVESHVNFGRDLEIFCVEENLYSGYQKIDAKIIDPREHIEEIRAEISPPVYVEPGPRKERVVILVDASNLVKAFRFKRVRIDMFALKKFLTGGRRLVTAYYYYPEPVYPNLRKYLDYIEKVGYTLIPGGGRNVDATIINHIPIIAEEGSADTIVCVSGDGHFLVVLDNAMTDHGINIEIASFDHNTFKQYAKVPEFKMIDLGQSIYELADREETMKKFGNDNGIPEKPEPTTPIIESNAKLHAQIIPKEVIQMAADQPVPKPARPKPTKEGQLVDIAKYYMTNGSIRGIHFDLVVNGKDVIVDIVKTPKPKTKK